MLKNNKVLSIHNSPSKLTSELREVLVDLCEQLEIAGLATTVETPTSWDHFEKLDSRRRERILEGFKNYSELIQSYLASGKELSDAKTLMSTAITHFGMRMPKGSMDLVQDEYVIEIYDLEGYQLFRNFKFLDCISYAFSELLVYDWPQLFRRPKTITDTLMGHFGSFAQGTTLAPISTQCPIHLIEEVFSENRNKALIDQKELIPLFKDNPKEVVAVMVLIKATLFSEEDAKSVTALDTKMRSFSDLN